MDPVDRKPRRVAVIGGGIAGIACTYALRAHSDVDVHIFEAEGRLGGHADTNTFHGNGGSAEIDTGFIAFNEETYPHFTAFLKALQVRTTPTDMSFGASHDDGSFEWSSVSFASFVGSFWNLFRLRWWRLMFDIIRFNLFATDIVYESRQPGSSTVPYGPMPDKAGHTQKMPRLESIGEYIQRKGYSEQFLKQYLVPMVASPWCIDPDSFSKEFPAAFLVKFMAVHRLLDTVTHTLRWRTFEEGSSTYVKAFLDSMPSNHRLHLNSPVTQVQRCSDGTVQVGIDGQQPESFEHVVLAVHANQALRMLGENSTSLEQNTLQQFLTTDNICYLHSDESLLPSRPSAHASWNCLIQKDPAPVGGEMFHPSSMEVDSEAHKPLIAAPRRKETLRQRICITFDMNRLQCIPSSLGRVLVTMNPVHQPHPSTVQGAYVYQHPLFTSDSVLALSNIPAINGAHGVSFAGAWMGYGFHEDGFVAGMQAAHNVLTSFKLPSSVQGATAWSNRYTRPLPALEWQHEACRTLFGAVQAVIEALGRC